MRHFISGTLDLLVEIIGPHGEMNSERISSYHPEIQPRQQRESAGNALKPPPEQRSKVITDSQGNRFIRQKSFDEDSNQIIPFDYQSIGEGRFLVTYVPRNTGVHDIVIKSHDHHIQGSPYQVSVSDWSSSWNIVGKSNMLTSREGAAKMKQLQEEVSNRFLEAGVRSRRHRGNSKQLTIAKRRVVKRMITRNGEEIVLSDFSPSPTLSRQSSVELSEDSEEEQKRKGWAGGLLTVKSRVQHILHANKNSRTSESKTIKEDIYISENETPNDTSDSLSVASVDSDSKRKSFSEEIKKLTASTKKKSPSPEVKDVHECASGNSGLPVHNSSHKPSVYTSMSDRTDREVEHGRNSSMETKLLKSGTDYKKRKDMSTRNSNEHRSKERQDRDHSDLGVSSSSSVTSTCFKSIVDHQSRRQSWTNTSHVVIVPTAKVDKTTQVTSEEIKNATGWHSGAFKIKKRKIYINQRNIQQKSIAAESDILANTDHMNGRPVGNVQNIRRNVFNVEEWLHSNESGIFGASSDRQSTFDTCDSGIADENQGCQNEHQRMSRRHRSNDIQFHPGIFNHLQGRGMIQFQGGSRRGTVHVPFSGRGELVSCSTDQFNFSDSELEYSSRRIQQRNRARRKTRTCCNGSTLSPSVVSRGKDGDRSRSRCLKRQASLDDHNQSVMKDPSFKGPHFSGCCDDQRDSDGICKTADNVKTHTNPARVSSPDSVDEHDNGSGHSFSERSQFLGERKLLSCRDTLLKRKADPPKTCGFGTDRLKGDKQYNPTQYNKDEPTKRAPAEKETEIDPLVQTGKQDHNDMKEQDIVKVVSGVQSLTEHIEGSLLNNDSPVSCLNPNSHGVKTIQGYTNPNSSLPDSDFTDETWFSKLFPKSVLELLANNPFSEAARVDVRLPGDLGEEEDCLAFGAGLSYGQVGMKNNFQVWVRYPCNGIVNISVNGPDPSYVTETSTTYTGDNLYEVMYEVTHPGYYVITVKWCGQNVADSPFITKIAWN